MAKGVAFDFYDPARIEAKRQGQKPIPAAKAKHRPLQFECCECGRPARYGEGVSLLRGIVGSWFCSKHAPDHLKYPGSARDASL